MRRASRATSPGSGKGTSIAGMQPYRNRRPATWCWSRPSTSSERLNFREPPSSGLLEEEYRDHHGNPGEDDGVPSPRRYSHNRHQRKGGDGRTRRPSRFRHGMERHCCVAHARRNISTSAAAGSVQRVDATTNASRMMIRGSCWPASGRLAWDIRRPAARRSSLPPSGLQRLEISAAQFLAAADCDLLGSDDEVGASIRGARREAGSPW